MNRWLLAGKIIGTACLLVFCFAVVTLVVFTFPIRVAANMSGHRMGWAGEAALLGGVLLSLRKLWPKEPEPKYVMHRLSPVQLEELAASIVAEERKRPWPGDEPTADYGKVPF
jgi:hypothetical protein